MVYGVRCMVAWCMVAWCMVHGVWCMVVWCMVYGAWCRTCGSYEHEAVAHHNHLIKLNHLLDEPGVRLEAVTLDDDLHGDGGGCVGCVMCAVLMRSV